MLKIQVRRCFEVNYGTNNGDLSCSKETNYIMQLMGKENALIIEPNPTIKKKKKKTN